MLATPIADCQPPEAARRMTEEAVAVEVRAPEPAVVADCKAALADAYAPTLQRMHKVLDELRCVALRAGYLHSAGLTAQSSHRPFYPPFVVELVGCFGAQQGCLTSLGFSVGGWQRARYGGWSPGACD